MELIPIVFVYLALYLGLLLVPAAPLVVPMLWLWARRKDSARDRGVLTVLAMVLAYGAGWLYSGQLLGNTDDPRVIVAGSVAGALTLYAFVATPRGPIRAQPPNSP